MSKILRLLLFVLWIILLTACEFTGTETPTPVAPPSAPDQTWIDAPLDDSTLTLQPYKLIFHAASHYGLDVFEVWINSELMVSVVPSSSTGEGGASGTLYYGEYIWTPLAMGKYLIGVRAGNSGDFGGMVEVNVKVTALEAELTTPLPLALTSSPTETATLTFTATPTATTTTTPVDLSCMLTSLVNLFCRPAPGYEPIDSFTPGQSAEVIGFSPDGFYAFLEGPNFGKVCTVPTDVDLVDITGGGCERLPQMTILPPPTATATTTSTSTSTFTPVLPQCSDGLDNDGDSLIDLNDRQCRDANDNDESTS